MWEMKHLREKHVEIMAKKLYDKTGPKRGLSRQGFQPAVSERFPYNARGRSSCTLLVYLHAYITTVITVITSTRYVQQYVWSSQPPHQCLEQKHRPQTPPSLANPTKASTYSVYTRSTPPPATNNLPATAICHPHQNHHWVLLCIARTSPLLMRYLYAVRGIPPSPLLPPEPTRAAAKPPYC